MLRTISLRNKLLLAVGLPIFLLAIGAGFMFNSAQQTVQTERTEDELVRSDLRALAVAGAIQREQTAGLLSSSEELEAARQQTDEAFADAIEQSTEQAETFEGIQTSLSQIRNELGSNSARLQELVKQEYNSPQSSFTPNLDFNEAISGLADDAIGEVQVNNDVYESGITVVHLNELVDLTAWENAIAAERGLIQTVLAGGAITDKGQIGLLQNIVAAENARTVALQSEYFRTELTPTVENPAMDELYRLRTTLRETDGGTFQRFDLETVSDSAAFLTTGIQEARAERIEGINNQHSEELEAASAQRANVLIGIFIVFVAVALILLALYRAISQPIRELSSRGRQMASDELPDLVEKIRTGQIKADTKVEPLVAETDDEIGELVHSLNELRSTAVGLAGKQAESRKEASEMFVNLGHRNQRILESVLGDLDDLEQDEQDPERLSKLYLVDQKVTRMRRNAESLLVLAGTQTPQLWAEKASLGDVVRAAMSEVENFERVESSVDTNVEIPGRAVADLTHLLAELLENALRFSPADRPVTVTSRKSGDTVKVYVADEGFGMVGDKLQEANQQIAEAAHREEAPSKHLGLFVVGRLATKHGISVKLNAKKDTKGLEAAVDLAALHGPAAQPQASPATSNEADTMPQISPAVPLSDEVRTHSQNSRSSSKTPSSNAGASAGARSTDDSTPKKRTPGANFVNDGPKSNTSPRTEAQPSKPEEVRTAFSGFQQSSFGAAKPAASPTSGARAATWPAAGKVAPQKLTPEPEPKPKPDARLKAKAGDERLTGGMAAALAAANAVAPGNAQATRAAAAVAAEQLRLRTEAEAEAERITIREATPKVTSRPVQRRVPGANLPASSQRRPPVGGSSAERNLETSDNTKLPGGTGTARSDDTASPPGPSQDDPATAPTPTSGLETSNRAESTETQSKATTELVTPTERVRRVPGANLPSAAVATDTPTISSDTKKSTPDDVRNAFASFQQSAAPSDSSTGSNETDLSESDES